MQIQSILMNKTAYKTRADCKAWLREHKFKDTFNPDPNPESKNLWRFRQRRPTEFKVGSFRTYHYNKNIYFVIGELK